MRYPPLSIVWQCPLDVSVYVALGQQFEVGEHACPECGQRLGGWAGYWRWVRGRGSQRLWIRRCRCSRCRRSHALLPDFLLERRLDDVHVIGQVLALSIVGGPIAERVGVPMTTARDWRRRLRVNALAMATTLVALAVHLDPTAVLLSTATHEIVALEVLALAGSEPGRASVNGSRSLAFLELDQRRPGRWAPTEARPRRRDSEQVGWRHPPEGEVGMSSDLRVAIALLRHASRRLPRIRG